MKNKSTILSWEYNKNLDIKKLKVSNKVTQSIICWFTMYNLVRIVCNINEIGIAVLYSIVNYCLSIILVVSTTWIISKVKYVVDSKKSSCYTKVTCSSSCIKCCIFIIKHRTKKPTQLIKVINFKDIDYVSYNEKTLIVTIHTYYNLHYNIYVPEDKLELLGQIIKSAKAAADEA